MNSNDNPLFAQHRLPSESSSRKSYCARPGIGRLSWPKGCGCKDSHQPTELPTTQAQYSGPVGCSSYGWMHWALRPGLTACFPRASCSSSSATSWFIYPASRDNINLYQAPFVLRTDIDVPLYCLIPQGNLARLVVTSLFGKNPTQSMAPRMLGRPRGVLAAKSTNTPKSWIPVNGECRRPLRAKANS